jgi:co-chaperonin GroES (HSP10)
MENKSGIVPLDLRILVKPDDPVTKIGSVHVPESVAEKAKYAGTKATFIEAGRNAFMEWGEAAKRPQPGDRVLFAQYSGARHKGADGADYIVMTDKDLLGVLEVEAAQ